MDPKNGGHNAALSGDETGVAQLRAMVQLVA